LCAIDGHVRRVGECSVGAGGASVAAEASTARRPRWARARDREKGIGEHAGRGAGKGAELREVTDTTNEVREGREGREKRRKRKGNTKQNHFPFKVYNPSCALKNYKDQVYEHMCTDYECKYIDLCTCTVANLIGSRLPIRCRCLRAPPLRSPPRPAQSP